MRVQKVQVNKETLEEIGHLLEEAVVALENGEQYYGKDPKEVLANLANAIRTLAASK